MLAGEPALKPEDHGRTWREQYHSELILVAALDVAVDAVADGGHHAVGADFAVQVATEGVDGPMAVVLCTLGAEEGDGLAVDLIIFAFKLANSHDDSFPSSSA